MPSIIQSFIPWILFFLLFGHSAGSVETASMVALISHALFNHRTIRRGFVFDIGTLIVFLLFTLNSFVIRWHVITNNGWLISTLALALIAWISLFIGKPFTLQYARLGVTPEITMSKLFLIINYILTSMWAVLLTLMALPGLIALYDPTKFTGDVNIAVSILLVVIGVWITKRFPDWFADRMIDRRFNVNIKKLVQQHRKAAVDFTRFNVNKLSHTPDITTDVIIVGAGPIGLTSALLLQQHGIDTVVIEKHAGTSIHPKARGISCRSMELLRKLGIDEAVKHYNLPKSQTWFGWFGHLTGKLYARVTAGTDYQNISPTHPGTAAQQYVEKVMLTKYEAQGRKVLFRHLVKDIAQNDELVQVFVKQRDTDESLVLQGKYLIAADGAHSTIRQLFDIPMIGPDEISVNFSVYCEIDLHSVLEEDKRFGVAFIVRPGSPSPIVLSIDGKKKWVFIFPGGGIDSEKIKQIHTDEIIKTKIYDIIGTDQLPIKIISKHVWSLGSQIANQFSAGRSFLAGDSLHRFSPTGAMGMNTGLQDADNLMWKLAYVIAGKAHAHILDTYGPERLPSVLENLQWSIDNLYRIVKISRSFEQQKLDDIDFQMLVQRQEAQLNKSGLDLGVIYASKLISAVKTKKPVMQPDQYFPTTYQGARLPHFELVKNNQIISSLDLISTQFVLLYPQKAKAHCEAIDFKAIPTQLVAIGEQGDFREGRQGEFVSLLGSNEFTAVWVRPDGHIAWKGSLDSTTDVAALHAIIAFMNK